MDEIAIDPSINQDMSASEIYRFEGTLYTLPFVTKNNDISWNKSRDEYKSECRTFPPLYKSLFDRQKCGKVRFSPPLSLEQNVNAHLKGSSSQHMTTILQGVEDAGYVFPDIDMLVTTEVLNTIAGSIFNQEKSWKLRAYVTQVQGKNMVIVCDDDFEHHQRISSTQSDFPIERTEALNFAHSICVRDGTRELNNSLHGSEVVVSTIKFREKSVKMIVIGEVDLVTGKNIKSLNTIVATGRTARASFGHNVESRVDSLDYLWSRCFWLGQRLCLVGMRSTEEAPVSSAYLYSLYPPTLKERKRTNYRVDVATTCVAQVMIRLREEAAKMPHANWIIEYTGRDKEFDPAFIKINVAPDTHSFLLVQEYWHIEKEAFESAEEQKKAEDQNVVEPEKIVRTFHQMKRLPGVRKSGTIAKQFQKIINSMSS